MPLYAIDNRPRLGDSPPPARTHRRPRLLRSPSPPRQRPPIVPVLGVGSPSKRLFDLTSPSKLRPASPLPPNVTAASLAQLRQGGCAVPPVPNYRAAFDLLQAAQAPPALPPTHHPGPAAPDAPPVAAVNDYYGGSFEQSDYQYDNNGFDDSMELAGGALANLRVEQPWERYLGRVEMGLGFFRKLWEGQWVMQGWDEARGLLLPETLNHFSIRYSNPYCDCSTFARNSTCIHYMLYLAKIDDPDSPFSGNPVHPTAPPAILILYNLIHPLAFSVAKSIENYSSGKRVIVALTTTGQWTCSGGCGGRCDHRAAAMALATSTDLLDDSGARLQGNGGPDQVVASGEEQQELLSAAASQPRMAVSHLPRSPPAFLRLDTPNDNTFPHIPSSLFHEPDRLSLDHAARCSCGFTIAELDDSERGASRWTEFTLFTRYRALVIEIETIACPQCSHSARRIGPDLVGLGLFNFNNQLGFAREYFDAFISAFSTSETPFVAFHTSTTDEYKLHSSPVSFCSISTFRRAFFAFAALLCIDSGMACPMCGPQPKQVICDGSVFGFATKYLSGALSPPTFPTTSSISRPDVVSTPFPVLSADMLGLTSSQLNTFRTEVQDPQEDGDSCRKFYEQYGKKSGLTGGMAGFWCSHGYCVGYHLLPSAEGRDDFFSALFCFWDQAPEIVVYDYACALGPYCMVREPRFFANTRFLIDELHCRGHSECSAACFLAPAMKEDPTLRMLNSSAAEGGHSTLGRVRKSISYMNESHANIFLWVMVQVHNRRLTLKMGSY
ncbi:hypothetical protein JCM1841_005602 [Sporobolomyces salmonicolor]